MKNFLRIKSIRVKKPDLSGVRKEWSRANIRRIFCYRPMLWLGLPAAALFAFVIIYAFCILGGFDASPIRMSVAMATTSAIGYFIGMVSLSRNKYEQKEEEDAGVKQTLLQKVITWGIFIAACVVLVWMEADEIIEDRNKWIETIGAILAILSTAVPMILAKLTDR